MQLKNENVLKVYSSKLDQKQIKTTAKKKNWSLNTVGLAMYKAHPRVLNMYFEGCLCFNVIQQNGLMSLWEPSYYSGLCFAQTLTLDWTS